MLLDMFHKMEFLWKLIIHIQGKIFIYLMTKKNKLIYIYIYKDLKMKLVNNLKSILR
jgi:hypothetical protein